jgi:hypothetical protein
VKERWATHPVLTDYEVSTHGRVRRSTPKRGTFVGRLKKPTLNGTGYLVVNINAKPKKVHVLVLETFVGPRPPGFDGCHRNGDRQQNVLTNLKWATRSANMADARVHGTDPRCDRHGGAKLSWSDVEEMRWLNKMGMLQKDLAGPYGISRAHVSYVVNRGWQP